MKNILIILIIFIVVFSSIVHSQTVLVIQDNKGFQKLILENGKRLPDTLAGFAFKVTIEDYKIFDSDNLAVVIQDHLSFRYKKFTRRNNVWEEMPTSGALSYNPYNMSYRPSSQEWKLPRNFKIVAEDVVTFQYDVWLNKQKIREESITKNCTEFIKEREKWLIDCQESINKTKSKKDEK